MFLRSNHDPDGFQEKMFFVEWIYDVLNCKICKIDMDFQCVLRMLKVCSLWFSILAISLHQELTLVIYINF